VAKLGAILMRCALGPVSYAGQCIMASKVPEGLRELAPEGLWGGLERGIGEVAKKVGVGAPDVASLLPMAELQATMARLGARQGEAVAAWQLHAGQIGGLLQGVADLTVDGRAPDVGLCLERLAKKVSRDKPLAQPLAGLAEEVTRWHDLVETACSALDDGQTGGRLATAYRKRRLRRAALVALAVVVPVVAVADAARIALSRGRVGRAIEQSDPCAVLSLDPADVGRASSDQGARIAERRAACEEGKKAEARRAEEERATQAKLAEQQRVRNERNAKCMALAGHVANGQLDDADRAIAGEAAALLERVAARKLATEDLGPGDPALPCADAPAAEVIRAAFDSAVAGAPWARVDDPSPAVRAALAARAGELPRWAKGAIAARANTASKKAIATGAPDVIERAVHLCELTKALGWPAAVSCTGATALAERAKPGG
jgi:hypothetical protein